MSTTILPALAGKLPDREAPTTADARLPSSASETWRAAFEQAGGERFGGWFQGPTERADAGASAGAAVLPAARTMGAVMPMPTSRLTPGLPGDAAPAPSARSPAAAHHTPARALAAPADTPSSSATPDAAAVPVALQATAAAALSSAQLPSMLESFLAMPVTWVAESGQAGSLAASVGSWPVLAGAPSASGEFVEDAASADDTPSSVDEQAPEHAAGAGAERDALRVHAEWSDAGVRVWLGADAQGLPDVAALTLQLQRWLAGQGMSLIGLVCNGRDVLDAPAQRQFAPLPRAARRGDTPPIPFDPSNLYLSETR